MMKYGDGEEVCLGDKIDVRDEDDKFEPEEAVIVKLGKKKIRVEFSAPSVPAEWVNPAFCELVSRSM